VKVPKTVERAAREKAAGGRPSVPQAVGAAAVAGAAAAVLVYKLLRG